MPDSLDLLTPYVLREQGQWFEKEIGFLGAFLKPGMQAIDIGANYGVYTLTMAGILGPAGTLWAFEPTSTTAACLGDSLTENRFGNVTLVQAALSDRVGTATLGLNPNSELNSLSVTPGAESEEVPVMTLDGCMAEFGWRHMDFIKLDAEGHEDNILRGGQSFLDAFWPLIMFEFKNGAEVNLSLIESFAGLGYSSYRYVPGLGALVPFASGEAPDQFELNLFCCKDDTASRLERDGILVTAAAIGQTAVPEAPSDWRQRLAAMPHHAMLHGDKAPADIGAAGPDGDAYMAALKLFMVAQLADQTAATRYRALSGALALIVPLAEAVVTTRLFTLARIYGELGFREQEVATLARLMTTHKVAPNFWLDAPFLPVCPRFDGLNPAGADHMMGWLTGQLVEQMEIQRAFSSFFTGQTGLQNLDRLASAGFMSEAMKRRQSVIRERFGLGPAAP